MCGLLIRRNRLQHQTAPKERGKKGSGSHRGVECFARLVVGWIDGRGVDGRPEQEVPPAGQRRHGHRRDEALAGAAGGSASGGGESGGGFVEGRLGGMRRVGGVEGGRLLKLVYGVRMGK
jgi:hypothetical protein